MTPESCRIVAGMGHVCRLSADVFHQKDRPTSSVYSPRSGVNEGLMVDEACSVEANARVGRRADEEADALVRCVVRHD